MPEDIVPHAIYQLKVTLQGAKPPIWRRLRVSSDLTLGQLHHVIQAAMGWYDCHLHEFRVGRQTFGVPNPEFSFMGEPACINERRVRISEVLGAAGAKAHYTYDFGDGWEHSILVEKVLAAEPDVSYPVCIDGKRNCPPEDCGGIAGYYDFLEAINDPQNPEHESLVEWIGGSFDPEAFSVDDVNGALAAMRRRRAKSSKRLTKPQP